MSSTQKVKKAIGFCRRLTRTLLESLRARRPSLVVPDMALGNRIGADTLASYPIHLQSHSEPSENNLTCIITYFRSAQLTIRLYAGRVAATNITTDCGGLRSLES